MSAFALVVSGWLVFASVASPPPEASSRPGEERFVRYATDLATLVETRTEQGRRPAFLVRVREGTFEVHYHRTRTTTYTVTNQSDQRRVVYAEQARAPGWDLDETGPRPEEAQRNLWRSRLEVGSRSSVEVPVTERLALMDRYRLDNLSEPGLREIEKRGLLDAASRAGLERVLALRARISRVEQEAAVAEREAAEIASSQSRLRENVKAVGDHREARELVARWLSRADQQEARLEALGEARRRFEAERRALRDEVEGVVRGLEGERKP